MPTLERAAAIAPRRGRRRHAAGSAARPRPARCTDAPVKALAAAARRADPAARTAEGRRRSSTRSTALRRRSRRRGRLRKDPDRRRSSPSPPRGFINVHASLLPRYRGAAPVHRAVIAGERETGVTIMRVVQALDAGPMLAHAHAADRRGRDERRGRARPGAARRGAARRDARRPGRRPRRGTAAGRQPGHLRAQADGRTTA